MVPRLRLAQRWNLQKSGCEFRMGYSCKVLEIESNGGVISKVMFIAMAAAAVKM